jgi:hypothetical protein
MLFDDAAINLVVNCTARKTVRDGAIVARDLTQTRLENRLARWTKSLEKSAAPMVKVRDLYCGDSWSIVRSLMENPPLGQAINWWVASAGYGVLRPSESVAPYSATFSRTREDSVLRTGESGAGSRDWWSGLCMWRRSRRKDFPSISRIAKKFPNHPLLIALSAEYVSALADDLLMARDELADADLLVIVSAGVRKVGPLSANFLPCDARLQSAVGGVRSSLNARIVRHILKKRCIGEIRISKLRKIFNDLLRRQPSISATDRKKLTDEAVIDFIVRSLLKDSESSHSVLLRILRDSGRACEQKRFRTLYFETRKALFAVQ